MSFFSSLLSQLAENESPPEPKIYLQCNGSRIQFPIVPKDFKVSVKQKNQVIDINNTGELNMIGNTGLRKISGFSAFFPNQNYYYCICTPDAPYSYVNQIDAWRQCGKPSRIIIADTPINFPVTIDSFEYGEKDGTGDVYYSLDLTEYKFVGGAEDSTIISETTGLKDRPSAIADAVENITVYPGDSIGDVVGRTIGKTVNIGDDNKTILSAYKKVAVSGGLNAGDLISYAKTTNVLKVNGKNV